MNLDEEKEMNFSIIVKHFIPLSKVQKGILMSQIFTYLEESQYDSIYDKDFSALDILMLTELSYLDYDSIVAPDCSLENSQRLSEISEQISPDLTLMATKERHHLLNRMAQSKRYKNIKAFAYINDIDPAVEKQFSALTFQLKPQTYLVVFRGTDDSIIGWKEDFHMTYMTEIPAQASAAHYLKKVMSSLPGDYILSGHSKGGNLALYAACQLDENQQATIQKIYSFDAPGLNKQMIQSAGYQAIAERIERYIPQGSIVGMMLEVPNKAKIVQSKAIGGFAQHNTFSWKIENGNFLLLDQLNPDSLQTDQTLKTWTASVSDQELKDFFDLFFHIILDAGIQSMEEVFDRKGLSKIVSVLENARSLSDEEKELLARLIRLLFSLRYQYWIEHFQSIQLDFPSFDNLDLIKFDSFIKKESSE